ncbi:MAG: ABC transporter permease [Actinomycetes bacterium]|jgi:NitT/TauT family transport system permease protein|nr:ABC transporter permease [Actinomycetes bacterium]
MATTKPPAAVPAPGAGDELAGLDALSVVRRETESLPSRLRRKALPPLVAIVVALGVWELVVLLELKPAYAVPPPSEVWHTLTEQWAEGNVQAAVTNSLRRGVVGFLASVVIGTVIGMIVARVRPIRTAIKPILTGLQIMPSVAWVPAAIIWFGLSDATYYAVVLLGAVPSIAIGLISGVDQVPPLFHRVGRVLGARRLSAVRHVLLPAAFPGYLAGLKQGWAFSWRSLMAAELIAISPELGLGLGGYLDIGRELNDMSWVLSGIFLILVVGIAVELIVFAPLERRMLRNRGLLVESR